MGILRKQVGPFTKTGGGGAVGPKTLEGGGFPPQLPIAGITAHQRKYHKKSRKTVPSSGEEKTWFKRPNFRACGTTCFFGSLQKRFRA